MAMGKFCRVFEKLKHGSPHSVILEHRNISETLLFESQAVAVLSAQEASSLKPQYSKLLEAYGCLGVLQLNDGENMFLYLVMVTGCVSVGKIYDSEVFRITQTNFTTLHYIHGNPEERIAEVRKVLNSGTFYFSWSAGSNNALDITLAAQRRYTSNCTDNRFFWNRMFHIHLLRFGVSTDQWLLKAMCGSIEIRTVYVGHRQARAVVSSRLSCERAGTRFNVRGTNDDGHVANFVETEQIIYLDNEVSSYIQTRGSVPLFWEQPGIQVGSHKIKMSRGYEYSAPAFDRHMSLLKNRYGRQAIVNLLGTSLIGSKEGEATLSQLFQSHHNNSQHTDVPHIIFDYHQECRGGNSKNLSKLREITLKYLEEFGFFYAVGEQISQSQVGTIRTNCLDCLDRTNCVQTFFGLEVLKQQLHLLKLSDKPQIVSRFDEVFRQMWINNGNEISKIYAGTGAIQGNSKLMDGARSAARTIQNNLLDSSKQEAIDILLLGSALNTEFADRARLLLSSNMLLAPSNVLREMCKRYRDFVNTKKLRVSIGTYNVNGGKHFRSVVYKDVTLSDWLLDAHKQSPSLVEQENDDYPVDIFVIGFEEIVDLNASNIMAASSENAKAWAEELQKVLSRDHEYVLLTYQQLVGVCLYVFMRPMYTSFLRDVAIDCVKTGLGGATGNKGAVAIRFVLYSTSFCVVCAHFAAGQSQVHERNSDYSEITKKVAFPMGRTLNSHDYVFWCGDFNYRVDMDKDEMKELIQENELAEILQYDQLKVQQQEGNVFQDFLEGPINFAPTYKYDIFSEDYDTSEKCRQPAWTDRILWRRRKLMHDMEYDNEWNSGKLIYYGRAELKQSDHRPVIATIDIDVHCVDEEKRDIVFREVIQDEGPPDGTVVIRTNENWDDAENTFDDDFMTALVQELSQIGEVILVRFVENTIWITFKTGKSALAAVAKGAMIIGGKELQIGLKSPDWVSCIEREIDIFKSSDTSMKELAFVNPPTRKFEELSVFSRSPHASPSRSPPPPRPPPARPAPARPPQPKSSGAQSTFYTELPVAESEACEDVPKNISNASSPDKTSSPNSEHAEAPGASPPPLPARNFPLPPPQMPPPSLPPQMSPPALPPQMSPPAPPTAAGPPIPARNAGPPLPPRNN